jgi:hypothetical protein
LSILLSHPAQIPTAGAFALWAPKLYRYYADHLGPLYEKYPHLRRNFKNSIFPCTTVNFGPNTCTFDHTDSANLPFGWCAITALGKFDPKLGGHLVLWDLKLVIEFPPGSTILIPSATLRHSNIAIQPGETRYSFTQYAAGALFRWVDQDFQPSKSYYADRSEGQMKEMRRKSERRWEEGIQLFSTLSSLQKS